MLQPPHTTQTHTHTHTHPNGDRQVLLTPGDIGALEAHPILHRGLARRLAGPPEVRPSGAAAEREYSNTGGAMGRGEEDGASSLSIVGTSSCCLVFA